MLHARHGLLTAALLLVVVACVVCHTAVALDVLAGGAPSRPAVRDGAPLLTRTFADAVNRAAKGRWRASHDNGHVLRNATRAQLKQLMGSYRTDSNAMPRRQFTAEERALQLPENFDAATNWPQCPTIREIRDQSNCGSCWAIAAAESISDRYCTMSGKPNVRIATTDLLGCCKFCGKGCNGGWPTMAWMWWTWFGLTTEDCQPYPFAPCAHHSTSDKYPACSSEVYDTPACNATCQNGGQVTRYKGARSYSVSGEDSYMRELMTKGPFEVALTVYADFLTYKSGVYSHVTGDQLGGHAVRLVGWGVQDGVPYWKIANSWNDDWGDKGYILIKRGEDECGIETSGVAGDTQ